MEQWIQIALTILGAGVASYIGMTIKQIRLESRVHYLEGEVGTTRDEGMRRHLHDIADAVQAHGLRIANIERRLDEE